MDIIIGPPPLRILTTPRPSKQDLTKKENTKKEYCFSTKKKKREKAQEIHSLHSGLVPILFEKKDKEKKNKETPTRLSSRLSRPAFMMTIQDATLARGYPPKRPVVKKDKNYHYFCMPLCTSSCALLTTHSCVSPTAARSSAAFSSQPPICVERRRWRRFFLLLCGFRFSNQCVLQVRYKPIVDESL